jgi:predicted negative regulator of RcsB-dependent stress response
MNQRKQELEHNELADALGDQIERVKPYVLKIGIALAVIAVITIGVYWFMSSLNRKQVDSWAAKIFATQVVDTDRQAQRLESVWKNHEPPASFWALLDAGYYEMLEGNDSYIQDNAKARSQLKSAKEKFEQILEDADSDLTMLRNKAAYLLAYAHESLGEFADAEKKYREFLDMAEDSPMKELGELGLARVTDPKSKEMFNQYVNWKAKVAPADPVISSRPDISFPESMLEIPGDQTGGGGQFDPNKSGNDPNSKPPTQLNPPVKKDDGQNVGGNEGQNTGGNEDKDKSKDQTSGQGSGDQSGKGDSNGGSTEGPGLNPPKSDNQNK